MTTEKTYTWTTPKGARITAACTVEHITEEMLDADGWKIPHECNHWHYRLTDVTRDGKPTKLKELTTYYDKSTRVSIPVILIDRMGKDSLYIAIPDDVWADLHAAEREYARQLREAHKDEEIAALRRRKAEAEKQPKLYTQEEARKKVRWYNNTYNEGNEGYVPHYYTQTEYDDICANLAELTQ